MAETGKKTARLPELLAPAGSFEALRAAVEAGADAVYFGGREFSARAGAENFDREGLIRAIAYCRERGVKTHVTANTVVLDRELDDWLAFGEFLWQAGADALICADLGAAAELARRLPDLPLHASTQAGVSDTGAASLLASLGFSRVVLARELPLSDIRRIAADAPVETEIFIHGALCVSVSGQCLFSSLVGGRSGNRGRCAQPCRLPYGDSYPLSLKDHCLAAYIPEIIASGVSSLKIEGRMRSPEYVYGVVSVYRRLLDEGRGADRRELDELARCFSRSGFTSAYFTGADRGDMLGVRTEEDKARTASLRRPGRGGERMGDPVFPLRPLPETAGGPLVLPAPETRRERRVSLCFTSPEQAESVLPQSGLPGRVLSYLPVKEYLRAAGERGVKPCGVSGVSLPAAFSEGEREELRRELEKAKLAGAERALAQSLGGLVLAHSCGFAVDTSFRFNVTNTLTALLLRRLGAGEITLSPELTLPAARDICRRVPASVVTYGRIPLMLLSRCLLRDAPGAGCAACESGRALTRPYQLRDRTGARFPVLPEYRHRNLLLNSCPTYLGDRKKDLAENRLDGAALLFFSESGEECAGILARYAAGEALDGPVRRAGVRFSQTERAPAKKEKNRPERNRYGKSIRNRYGDLEHPPLRQGEGDPHPGAVRRGGRSAREPDPRGRRHGKDDARQNAGRQARQPSDPRRGRGGF